MAPSRHILRVVRRSGQLLGWLAVAWCVCCAAPVRSHEARTALAPVARDDALVRPSESVQPVCDERSQRVDEVPSVSKQPLELDRPSPSAGRVDRHERSLETICEVALLSCVETETVRARPLWTWEDGARLELSMVGRSKIGAVYRTTW